MDFRENGSEKEVSPKNEAFTSLQSSLGDSLSKIRLWT